MRPRSPHPPQTPAERQAKCRAIKRGEWFTYPALPVDRPPLSHALLPSGAAPPALPAPKKRPPALPAPPITAIQKAVSAEAKALAALPDAGGPDNALRLSLPPAVAARLQSLLERRDAGMPLTDAERAEAQGLLDIAEFFVVQRLRRLLAA